MMYTLNYSFCGGWITPEQLSIILDHACGGVKLTSFSTISIPLGSGLMSDMLKAAHVLADKLGCLSAQKEEAVDVSSFLLYGDESDKWRDFANRLCRLSIPVSYPFYEIMDDEVRLYASDSEPERRVEALHKRSKISLECEPYNEFGLFAYDLSFVVPNKGKGCEVHLFAGGGGGIYGGSQALEPHPAVWMGEYSCDEALAVACFLQDLNARYGDTSHPRKRRLKSLFATKGIDWVYDRIRESGMCVRQGVPPVFTSSGETVDRQSECCDVIYVPGGMICDLCHYPLMSLLREILPVLSSPLRITPHGNIRTHPNDREACFKMNQVLRQVVSPSRISSYACKGAPFCRKARASSSVILHDVVGILDRLLVVCGLSREQIVFRMSGCPNGCSRPLFAELALIGRSEGVYDLFAGGSRKGDRIAVRMKKSLTASDFSHEMESVLKKFACDKEKQPDLIFGDWIYGKITGEGF